MASQKKWIKSAFGDLDNTKTFTEEPQNKRSKLQTSIGDKSVDSFTSSPPKPPLALVPLKCRDINSSNWVENFAPQSISDLAVHPKKIEELQHWLRQCEANHSQIPGPILLITGPSGSGKTATFSLVAKQCGYAINEWVTPVDVELQRHNQNDAFRDDDTNAYSETQSDQFSQFLFRASRYSSVFETSAKRVVLVEDFPNLFLKDVEAFNTILEHYLEYGKSPLVFIVADTKSKKLDFSYNLFGDATRQQYKIDRISFNAVSTTLLKKGLKRILDIMAQPAFNRFYKSLPVDCIESIVQSALGDIRNAVINLHFAAQKDSGTIVLKACNAKSSTKGRKPKNSKLSSMGCDETVTMMHALGRVLNPKYQETNSDQLLHSPEQLADDFMSQPAVFMNLLHANYLCHFKDIDDIVQSTDMLSIADVVLNEWRDEVFTQIGLNIAIRGVMVCNRNPATGWLPIRGQKKCKSKTEEDLRAHFGIGCAVMTNVMGADYRTFANIIREKQQQTV